MSNFIIYNASAGSGKTYTVTREYLKLCLDKNPYAFKNILAVTFTNKAAQEMRERIIGDLIKIKSNPQDEKLLSIAKELNEDENTVRKKAVELLSNILHNYSDFPICTIDKFFHQLVRVFAVEMKLQNNFSLETDMSTYSKRGVESLMEDINVDEDTTSFLTKFALQKINTDEKWDVRKDLIKISKSIERESFYDRLPKLKRIKKSDVDELLQIFSEKTDGTVLRENARALLNKIKDKDLENSFRRGCLPNYLSKIENGDSTKVQSTLIKCINGESTWCPKSRASDEDTVLSMESDIISFINFSVEKTEEIERYKNAQKKLYPTILLHKVNEKIENIKKENNIIFISDFNKLISKRIKNLPARYIYEKIGEKYKHYFIDEFQDTSSMQWHNFLPLLENSTSQGGDVTLVGDGKQAIYRWRNGNVKQFLDLSSDPNNFQKTLEYNFRSAGKIVEFNNVFFSSVKNILEDKENIKVYDSQQKVGAQNLHNEGFVQISTLEKDQETVLSEIKIKIEQCLSKGYLKGDIAVIVRNNSEIKLIAEYLISNNIEVISSEGLLLKNHSEINFLISILKALANPLDKKYLAHILIFLGEMDFISKDVDILGFFKRHDIKLDFINQLSIYELTEFLAFKFLDEEYKSNVYIQNLYDEILHFTSRNIDDLHKFLEYWDTRRKDRASISSQSNNGVKILTIHKSKGLEFPIVIIPFLNWKINLSKEIDSIDINGISFDISAKYSENHQMIKQNVFFDNLNLLYVAFTRAQEHLYLFTNTTKKKNIDDISDVSHIMELFLKGRSSYELGVQKCFSNKKNDHKSTYTVENIVFNNWRKRDQLSIEVQAQKRWIDNPKTLFGNTIHDILSKIESEKDLKKVLINTLNEGIINYKEKNQLHRLIEGIVNHKKIKPFFSSDVYTINERDIVLEDGKVLRPDRVVVFPDKSIGILDFKTGEKKDEDKIQIKQYISTLKRLERLESIKAFLVYTKNGIQVEEAL
ncbi:UvrD-helicase domain-containing protein [Ichthyobacterium seriolicida]|uniref:DNA 3'-5' helicase n=1 Tax=Ichthyobacterium seriolicida TaxID=242600 RepID=A0A1J1E8M3_9FLAO|nr:UvrD-helicase domain-containing protein [Ichthyobacterium seriolicida]BAV94283.1 ATP-dependent helicase [Ichthyobacterium seriolicida]